MIIGDFQTDVITVLGPIFGKDKVNTFIKEGTDYIEAKAKEGAEQAIPDITTKVKTAARQAILPYIVGAVAGAGALSGLVAFLVTRRAR